jgi:hypothetical protein
LLLPINDHSGFSLYESTRKNGRGDVAESCFLLLRSIFVIDLFVLLQKSQIMKRHVFIRKLCRRFSLRLHMTLILFATVMVGITASKLLLMFGFSNPALRYPIIIIFAYAVFFIAIKIWLWIVIESTAINSRNNEDSLSDLPDVSFPDGTSSQSSETIFSGGGGEYSGGGASGSYGESITSVDSSGSSDGFLSSCDIDEGVGVIILFAFLALLLFLIFGSSAYLIYQAPSMLSEIAFDSVLAVSLARTSKRMQNSDWVGSVLNATWKQFAGILLISIIVGISIHVLFPEVTKVSELYRIVFRN